MDCKVLFCTPSIGKADTLKVIDSLRLDDASQLPHLESVVLIDNEYQQKGRPLSSLIRRVRGGLDYRELLVRTPTRPGRLLPDLSPDDIINLQYSQPVLYISLSLCVFLFLIRGFSTVLTTLIHSISSQRHYGPSQSM